MHARSRCWSALLLTAALPLFAADKHKPAPAPAAPTVDPWDEPQPAVEKLDLNMYNRIREEGLQHSRVMDYASALEDDIGPRLTGSPNMAKANAWTRDQFTAMGCANAHLEDWGEFGIGWQQINTWVRMTAPDTAVFIAQATPWSPPTNGPVTGDAVHINIQDEKDFDQYRGKLEGKIVLLGPMRPVPPVDKPLFTRLTDQELQELAQYQISERGAISPERLRAFLQRMRMTDKIAQFLADEKVAGVIVPSRDGRDGGGSGGTFFDDNGAALGREPYIRGHEVKVPVVVTAIENYGRVYRLLQAQVPVQIQMDVETKFTGDHEHGYDTVAEIPGTYPNLKDQVVMVGGHLDSWIAGTGATDNGAGSVVAMEVMRILTALHVQPRRTIRVALWSGEEQGLFGSRGYVRDHFGSAPLSTAPDQAALPEFLRRASGPLQLKPEQRLISGYFNLDNGSGRIRGVHLQENASVAPIFAQWIAPLKDLGVTTLTMRNTGGTDHLSFDAVGIPGFQFIQDPLDYETRTHHSNMDVYEELQASDLKQAAVVEAIFVYNAAMRDQMLPRKPLPHPERQQENAPPKNLFPDAKDQGTGNRQ
ncbi:MAG TPA: M20/M25/M40 family metallo-hydrolase [Acidobacteriaceae bacterium]|nr:M20/M25/M40 family metallo-hydrolase [Acidobacteriaceae bacterium]